MKYIIMLYWSDKLINAYLLVALRYRYRYRYPPIPGTDAATQLVSVSLVVGQR